MKKKMWLVVKAVDSCMMGRHLKFSSLLNCQKQELQQHILDGKETTLEPEQEKQVRHTLALLNNWRDLLKIFHTHWKTKNKLHLKLTLLKKDEDDISCRTKLSICWICLSSLSFFQPCDFSHLCFTFLFFWEQNINLAQEPHSPLTLGLLQGRKWAQQGL